MSEENPTNAVLLEKIANLTSSCARIEGWLDQISHRTVKQGRILAVHSSLLALIGAGLAILFSKAVITF